MKNQSVQPAEIVIADASDEDGLGALFCDNAKEKFGLNVFVKGRSHTQLKKEGRSELPGPI